MTEEEIVAWVVQHAPPDSGPVFLAVADNWYLVSQGIIVLLACVAIVSLSFAVSVWSSFDD
jgi:hypothetical protein